MTANLFIEETGQEQKQTIIFLHASGSSSKMWQHHIAALKNDFHCIAIDLPGHGNSRNIEWTTFDDVTEMIASIIKAKAHGKPHLVGLSLGASLILKLLVKEADLVGQAIVDGSSHQPIKGYRKVIAGVYVMSLLKNTKLVAKLMSSMMAKDGVPEEEYRSFVADLQQASKRSFHRAMSQANLLRINLRVDNPVFFVSGGKESGSIHESHQLLVSKNPASECAYYPDKGHAWLFSDVTTHIQLVQYFLQRAAFPNQLRRFAD
ncbi:alpha/beta fold hydrolase [Streptococcus dentasini]